MDAVLVIRECAERGITLAEDAGDIVVRPWSALPGELLSALKEHKPEILEHLRRNYRCKHPESDRSADVELEEIAAVEQDGYVLLQADWLPGETIAFAADQAAAQQVPDGIVTYTSDEIRALWGPGMTPPTPPRLRLIHVCKTQGATILEPIPPRHADTEGGG